MIILKIFIEPFKLLFSGLLLAQFGQYEVCHIDVAYRKRKRERDMSSFFFCGDFRLGDDRGIRSVIDADGSGRWAYKRGRTGCGPAAFRPR